MDKRLAYLLIAIIVLISFGTTIFIYWQQTASTPTSEEQTAEVYFAGSTSAEIIIQNQNLTNGQRATVPIYLKTDTDVATVQLVLEYDASTLEIDDSLTDESDQFDTPYNFDIDDTKPLNARRITMVANNISSGVNTNGTQLLLANLRITPHLPAGQQSVTSPLKFIFSSTSTDSTHAITLTALNNVLSQPTDPIFTISSNTTATTTLSITEKELVLDEATTLDITLTSPQLVTAVNVILNYDSDYLNISSTYIESDDFDSYSLVDIDKTNGQVTIHAESNSGKTGELTIITLNVTPISASAATNISFAYAANNTADSNVFAGNTTDILSAVNNATYEIVKEASVYACYTACDSDSQCPSNECALANGEYICINLNCTNSDDCSCPESEYLSQSGTGGTSSLTGTFFSASASATPKPTLTPKPTTTPIPTNTPQPTATSSAKPIIADLPQAGSSVMTLAVLALGISALLLGLITRKDLIR